jgi:hypothetical protein
MKSITLIVALLIAAALAGGCVPSGLPPVSHHAVADENFNAVWDATRQVLSQYRFGIDRADRRAGVIRTFPMIGRHWFEFWRKDAATRRDLAEGSLHTIYRQVTVHIRRKDKDATGSEYLATVMVQTGRSDLPSPQVTSTSEAYDLFLNPLDMPRSASLTGLSGRPGGTYVKLGRDENLEQILQRKINFLAAKNLTTYPR